MPITDSTFQALSTALSQLRLQPVSREEAEALIRFATPIELQKLTAAARAGDRDARGRINGMVLSVKSLDYVRGVVPSTTVEAVAGAIRTHGYSHLREVMIAAVESDDPNAKAVLAKLLSSKPAGFEEGGIGGELPLHETDVPPPGDFRRPGHASYDDVPQPESNASGSTRVPAVRRSPSDTRTRTPEIRNRGNVSYIQGSRDQDDPDILDRDLPSSSDFAPTAGTEATREYDQHCCYGRDIAAQFERSPTKKDRSTTTINIKVGRAKGSSCKGGVDWNHAIQISLEPHEVQLTYVVLLGYGKRFRGAGHGTDNQKWFEVQETEGQYAGAIRLTVAHGQDRRSLNIGHTDLKEVMEVFSRALQDQSKGQSPAFMLAELKRVYAMYDAHAGVREANRPTQGQGQAQRRHYPN